MITGLFYSHILNMKRGSRSIHTKRFRRIRLTVFIHGLIKNCFAGPKSLRGFRETGPSGGVVVWMIAIETTSSARTFVSRHTDDKSAA